MFYSVLLGFILIAFGLLAKLFPPKQINNVYGYRTEMSVINEDTWKEGNRYCASQYLIAGILMLLIGTIGFYVFKGYGVLVAVIAFIPVLKITVFTTNKHLEKLFDKEGNRKTS